MSRNPFRPTAGATPPLLIGRDAALAEFAESLEDGPGAPGRLALFTGARGVGKTVMLTESGDRALRLGWITLAETATAGMLSRLHHATSRARHELDPASAPGRSLTGITLPVVGGGVSMSPPPIEVADWRVELGQLLDVAERGGTGVLITVDEVHHGARADLRNLAAVVQHLIREDREIALAMAGLPSAVSDLLNDDVLTFLRRAHRFDLGDVALDDVADALRTTIVDGGLRIDEDALAAAATATGGYPFMIQLVGYHLWRRAVAGHIGLAVAQEAIDTARQRLGAMVHATALADLSAIDRQYLIAMARDDDESSTGEIARRLEVSAHYASTYRSRLIEAGLIEPSRYGYVRFSVPYLREYLRENGGALRDRRPPPSGRVLSRRRQAHTATAPPRSYPVRR